MIGNAFTVFTTSVGPSPQQITHFNEFLDFQKVPEVDGAVVKSMKSIL